MSDSKFFTLEELKTENVKFFKDENMPVAYDDWSAADVGLKSALKLACYGEGISMLRAFQPKGFHWKPHSHPHRQISVMLEGVVEFTVDGQTQIMKAGDVIYMPPNVAHSGEAKEDAVMLDICIPAREDHLAWYYPEVEAHQYHEEAGRTHKKEEVDQ